MKTVQPKNEFLSRHLGPREHEIPEMLNAVGVSSIDELIDQTIPETIRSKQQIQMDPAVTEYEILNELREIAKNNIVLKSFLGQGYYNCITPSVIRRNIFENPGWYTQVHTISTRDFAGPARGAYQLPDNGFRLYRNAYCERLVVR